MGTPLALARTAAVLALAALLAACERAETPPAPRGAQTGVTGMQGKGNAPADAQQNAAAAPATAERPPDVMDGKGPTAGALVGTGETYGGPSHFGGPLADPEVLRIADAPSGMVDPLHGRPMVSEQPPVLPIPNQENRDIRRNRSFVLQPPTIPHRIDGYQIDLNANRCMTCHGRTRIEESKAVPVSITHYTDRAGNMLADISPRRYFCDQCHVVQHEAKPLVENRYEDVEDIVRRDAAGARARPDAKGAPGGNRPRGAPAPAPGR